MLERGKPGHWGLTGIRERAQNVGGKAQGMEPAGAGTEIELLIPAQLVYRSVPTESRWRRLKRFALRQ